jgi:hypothetical protein
MVGATPGSGRRRRFGRSRRLGVASAVGAQVAHDDEISPMGLALAAGLEHPHEGIGGDGRTRHAHSCCRAALPVRRPAAFVPETVGLGVEPAGDRHPELGRELQRDHAVPDAVLPVPCVLGGVLPGAQLVRIDRARPPVSCPFLQRLQAVVLGDAQEIGTRTGTLGFRPHQLAGLGQ